MIPIGGGIPAGVLLAQKKGLLWAVTAVLYLISDLVLACLFEPVMKLLFRLTRKSKRLSHIGQVYKQTIMKKFEKVGVHPTPWNLILLSFGSDPMTGRTVAHSFGHGFITGWMIAIAGDMIFFSILMVSTIWLQDVIGDSNIVILIVLLCMFLGPYLYGKIKDRR